MTDILVVGGAGYIGSHTCLDLSNNGFTPVVYDNLRNGHAEFVQWGPLEHGDIRDRARTRRCVSKVPNCRRCALCGVDRGRRVGSQSGRLLREQCRRDPDIAAGRTGRRCWENGILVNLRDIWIASAIPMDESHPQMPINPYGRSKLIVEQMLGDLDTYAGFRSVVLRYFNAAGADPEGRIGEWHSPETHAIPLAIETALGRRAEFSVFGSDYDTRDGTCVRDFIHVMDLADAHTRAVRYLLDGGNSVALNLGSGDGTSVKELLSAIETTSGRSLPVVYAGRREGNSPVLVADNRKARSVLGWKPRYDLNDIVRTAWQWHSARSPSRS